MYHPYKQVTNTVICCLLNAAGDMIVQYVQKSRQLQTRFDLKRTWHLTLTGLTIGPLCHFWYILVNKCSPQRSISAVMKKVLADQLLFLPIMWVTFFLTIGYLQDSSLKKIGREIYHKGN